MTETLFYHLERRSLEDVLPGLIEKSLERGWRVLIRADSAERAEMIDNLLWTYDDQTFLPHAQAGDGSEARQPVLITVEDTNPNAANVLFLVGGAQADWNATAELIRIVMMFDGPRCGGAGPGACRLEGRQIRGPRCDLLEGKPCGQIRKAGLRAF